MKVIFFDHINRSMKPKQIFDTGLQYHHYANTAYPLTPSSYKQFRIKNQDEYLNFLKEDWKNSDFLSLYVHIPFCEIRCKFCEYVVLEGSDLSTEEMYVSLLLKEIEMYKTILKGKKIVGYDLGGGTPTKLSVNQIKVITDALLHSFDFDKDVVFSIETTPIIAAQEPQKLEEIFKLGYKRMSMGIQTVSEKLLNDLGREGTTQIYERAVMNIRQAGFEKFNIDLMYGFLHQNDEDFENTLHYAIALKPDYITLYRNRYKGTKLEQEAGGVSLYKIISQYRLAYRILLENGYKANVGKNTFSKIDGDYGTSDYLTKRVIEGVPYVGLGLGAQSFGNCYLAYNSGAANKQLNKYKQQIESNQIPIQDLYSLDLEESIAKMVSVAFYFGFVDLEAFKQRFQISFIDHFKNEVDFVLQENLMEIQRGRLLLTNRGADYINGVIPLFYSERSKKELIELFNKSNTLLTGEAEFLKAYSIKDYERPSVATDIVAFVQDKQPVENTFSVVLIKRGEHPYMNDWALPGGFVRSNESIERAAYRELREETGITDITLSQLQVFSEPQRDPRGWIISCAFMGVCEVENQSLLFGEDAIDVQIFNIHLSKMEQKEDEETKMLYKLVLSLEQTVLTAEVEKEMIDSKIANYKVIDSKGIAFDHAKILVMALEKETVHSI
jgi:oxygen-independent coproporphyrinogen-3 oxidase